MGKVKDTINWLKDKTEKVKDTFGTGIEALKPGPRMMGIGDKMSGFKSKFKF